MRQKWAAITLAAMLAAVFLAGCKENVGTPEDNAVVEEPEEEETQKEPQTVGLSCPDMQDPFYSALKESIKAALESQGDSLIVQNPGTDAGLQNEQVQSLIDSGVDAVFLWPADPEESSEAVETLSGAGIPTVILGVRTENADLADAFIGADDRNAGAVCAEDLKERRPDGGRIVLVESPDQTPLNERITGFEETIANSGFEVAARIDPENSGGDAGVQMKAVLEENGDPDAVMCGNDRMAVQVLAALEEEGRTGVLVYSVGGSPEVKTALADPAGSVAGVGALSPINMGKAAAQTVTALLEGGKYEKEQEIETFLINRENLEIYGTDGWQ